MVNYYWHLLSDNNFREEGDESIHVFIPTQDLHLFLYKKNFGLPTATKLLAYDIFVPSKVFVTSVILSFYSHLQYTIQISKIKFTNFICNNSVLQFLCWIIGPSSKSQNRNRSDFIFLYLISCFSTFFYFASESW